MNEIFFDLLKFFLSEASLTVHDIDGWHVISGPGSFTGIRIGIAALTGITQALNKELHGISSLDACALVSGKDKITVAAKLKLNEYACASYDFTNSEFSEPVVSAKDELPENAYIIDNSGVNLAESIADKRIVGFIRNPAPIYIKKSEAEINFDKKSHTR